ncbi:pyruvate, phosphate dikinase [Methylocella tundrae]|uniref:Pyruvate, phosphate dikinase n=1 Tax=Methylocella tundrae TaxID=227605 RepID=A0A4U8YXI9_METTU|nr:pyruvate, phosphate dikinase [Methylocella tundrae]WPP05601.1 pyruvate, phosphate dikinase [Methylocella tundrae]VFU08053.1 Pyruvate, phosphate dikinase [Methylocella tundrae]
MAKWVYTFGDGRAEGSSAMRDLLGGKGADLAEMANLGLPVPPGFTITTDVCTYFYENQKRFPSELAADVEASLAHIGKLTGKTFGDEEAPLLVSVRSGARASMPGMMDTVLNLGLNDFTVRALAKSAGDERFAFDSYRRFIQMYSNVVLGIGHHHFEDALESYKEARGVSLDTELRAEDWQKLVVAFKATVEEESGKPFPQSAQEQLWGAIAAVFGSWLTPRAIIYRRIHGIPSDWGTAVNVQAMVFGNMGPTSATGVAFTRNPSTGAKELYGEFLINAQGEDVVSGIRTPQNITETARLAAGSGKPSMETAMPVVFAEFVRTTELLERHYRDMQDMEFTVENGKLWMLQTRSGKRTSLAALRIAVDMTCEGLISKEEAINRIDPASLDQLLHPAISPHASRNVIAAGLPASPGAASGEIVFSADEAEQLRNMGRKVVLVRIETCPDDIHGMHAAEGILTTRGGMTSHAAVVARGMGKPCVTGAATIRVDYAKATMSAAGVVLRKGDMLTIDGATGQVIQGSIRMSRPELTGEFAILMKWADEARRMEVRANAETPQDARAARKFGAEGIGLCRTEHMFFEGDRLTAVREMILADDPRGRRAALDKLLPMQRSDFIELFGIMAGLPVTIRLLDPPLHEFLPHAPQEIEQLAVALGLSSEKILRRLSELKEVNPMLGFRGSRLTIAYPEITEMQARAIFEAAVEVKHRTGALVRPEIMAPLIIAKHEFDLVKARVDAIAKAVETESGQTIPYTVGTMIETPRACLRAGEIAATAEFFSFGTNDLTQTCLALSRDDAGSFLGPYVSSGILAADPFVTIDREGVGELVAIAAQRSRATRPEIKLGICGEHGGDPASIEFCEKLALDYVSCSPFRVPIARLAAAQAAIALKKSPAVRDASHAAPPQDKAEPFSV